MMLRKHNAWLGCALLMAGCQLLVSSRGEDQDPKKQGACGNETCLKGTECCNASCGICTEPNGVCLQIACEPATVDKTCNDLSCPKGEGCMDTPAGAQCVPAEENPCNLVDCAPQHVCEVVAGAATCRPWNSGSDASTGNSDGGSLDDAGSATDAAGPARDASNAQDAAAPGVDATVPGLDASTPIDASLPRDANPNLPDTSTPPATCAVTLCPVGTYCDDIGGSAKCIKTPSCETVKCAAGQHCELIDVVCVRAPCPPQPMCVDNPTPVDPCATIKCAAGTHCEVFNWCIAPAELNESGAGSGGGAADLIAPERPIGDCTPTGRCVANSGSCGATTCATGTFCCNASCGVCAPKKGACLAQVCPAAETD
jgi:hypothetical protein